MIYPSLGGFMLYILKNYICSMATYFQPPVRLTPMSRTIWCPDCRAFTDHEVQFRKFLDAEEFPMAEFDSICQDCIRRSKKKNDDAYYYRSLIKKGDWEHLVLNDYW